MSDKNLPVALVTRVPSMAPPSFDGDMTLYTFNLFLMTAMFFLGLMLAGQKASQIWQQRHYDHLLHPVSLYRIKIMFASIAIMFWCGAEAMLLWGWNPHDPMMTARIIVAKRWLDPIANTFAFAWMTIAVLSLPGIEHLLRRRPVPMDMWSRWPALARAAGVVVLSFIAALAAVILR